MLRNMLKWLGVGVAVTVAYVACYAQCYLYNTQTTCADINSTGPTDPAFMCNGFPAVGFCTSAVYVYTITSSTSGKYKVQVQCSCQCEVDCNGQWIAGQWCDTGLINQLSTTDCAS